MYKSLWARVLACLAVVVVLSLSILPLMASASDPLRGGDRWGQEAPDFSNFYALELDEFSRTGIVYLANGVNFAYAGGMFSGSIPIAIIAKKQAGIVYIDIIALSQNATPNQASMGSKEEARDSTTCRIGRVNDAYADISFSANRTVNPTSKIVAFRVCDNGDFAPLSIENTYHMTYAENFSQAGSAGKLLAVRTGYFVNEYDDDPADNPTGSEQGLTSICDGWYISPDWPNNQELPDHWFAPATTTPTSNAFEQWARQLELAYAVNGSVWDDGWNDGYDDGHKEGREQGFQSGYDEGYDAGFDPGYRQGYDDGYTEGEATVPPVTLDIPSIFTALFGATHDILGGFDISIFGISIVGLLVAIIVITVVSFLIKKLLK